MNWLLLRGLIREQGHWDRFDEVFREVMGPGHQVFKLDLPGVGTEHQRASPAQISQIRQDLRQRWLEQKNGVPGPWAVLAISLGAMAAMDWAQAHPEDFKHLTLINSSAGNVSWPHQRMRISTALRCVGAALQKSPVVRERNILLMTTRMRADLDALAQSWARMAELRPVARPVAIRQLLAAIRFKAPAALRVPVLVLSSQGDEFTSPQCSQALAQRFHAPHVVHPKAGHDITLDDPRWVAEQIKAQLAHL